MKQERKIAMVARQVRMGDEDDLDVSFWLSKTFSERLSEVTRLRKNYFTSNEGVFPEKVEKVVSWRKL